MFDFNLREMVLMVIPVLTALTFHEYAHGLMAYRLGDPTAKMAGRLTLNPLAHLDPVGTVMLFFSRIIGWAKPVPFDPRNFKNPARDTTLVALAGPLANFALAVALAFVLKMFYYFNVFGMMAPVAMEAEFIFHLTVLVNVSLGVFNLLPCPPLDGFKVVSYFLPPRWVAFAYGHQVVFVVAFVVLIVSGALPALIRPVVWAVFGLLN